MTSVLPLSALLLLELLLWIGAAVDNWRMRCLLFSLPLPRKGNDDDGDEQQLKATMTMMHRMAISVCSSNIFLLVRYRQHKTGH
jgi:hypothetical protein